MSKQRKGNPEQIQPTDNRPAEMDELQFEDNEPSGLIGDMYSPAEIERDQSPERAREAGLTGAAMPGKGPTDDDLAPETLIDEDGARSPVELGHDLPTDRRLSETEESEIGGGTGLDEAELARVDPLDKKCWDGNRDDRLQPAMAVDKDFPAVDQSNEEGHEDE